MNFILIIKKKKNRIFLSYFNLMKDWSKVKAEKIIFKFIKYEH